MTQTSDGQTKADKQLQTVETRETSECFCSTNINVCLLAGVSSLRDISRRRGRNSSSFSAIPRTSCTHRLSSTSYPIKPWQSSRVFLPM
ncbi:hypothetical protein PoB_007447100 [Plakobranchus ocellatus]|uniref:Uncharacterized protein n=1 Tax=Plakobranchus ocellatus TaxID=259542 RepID=A0AAV4DVN1_9GAST|nr:hypothetical protein PoB_007447100 [Plakobranchus ocellatus]